jgi:hypothetical protein
LQLSWGTETLSQPHIIVSCFENIVWSDVSLPLVLWEYSVLNSKVKVSAIILSKKVKIWNYLKAKLSLVEVGQHRGKNESNIHGQCSMLSFLSMCSFPSTEAPWKHVPVYTKGLLYIKISARKGKNELNYTYVKYCWIMIYYTDLRCIYIYKLI